MGIVLDWFMSYFCIIKINNNLKNKTTMKTMDYLHLDSSKIGNVISGLEQLLADYQVFYTNLRGFHWNIKGHGFFVLHSKFEEMYDNAAAKDRKSVV